MSRFITPALVTLPLSDGDTLTIRERLTHGETQASYARMTDAEGTVDRLKIGDALIVAYLVDWTFRDGDGRVVPIQGLRPAELLDVVNNLDQASYLEVVTAI